MHSAERVRLRVNIKSYSSLYLALSHNLIVSGADRYPPSTPATTVSSRTTMFGMTLLGWFASIKPDFREILPIDVEALHGAIVCGNQSTPSLLVAKFLKAHGSYNVVPVRN